VVIGDKLECRHFELLPNALPLSDEGARTADCLAGSEMSGVPGAAHGTVL